MSYILSLDIGGTKIATILTDLLGNIISRVELQSDTSGREEMFTQVVKSVHHVMEESKIPYENVFGMGVGVPGKIDRENGIAVFQNNLPWQNFPIVDRLKNEFSVENIVLDNDVYMATFAEWKAVGANKDDTFVYVTVSTGISCSIIHQGEFLRGNGFAGEVGLLPVYRHPTSDDEFVTLEKAASGSAIEGIAQEKFNQKELRMCDLFRKYKSGDLTARKLIQDMAENLAFGLYSIACLLDPDKIVLGGGVINNQAILLDLIKQNLEKHLISEQKSLLDRIITSTYKGDSGVMGAAYRAIELLENRKPLRID